MTLVPTDELALVYSWRLLILKGTSQRFNYRYSLMDERQCFSESVLLYVGAAAYRSPIQDPAEDHVNIPVHYVANIVKRESEKAS